MRLTALAVEATINTVEHSDFVADFEAFTFGCGVQLGDVAAVQNS